MAGKAFPRPIAVGVASNIDTAATDCGREVEVTDGALPKILRAEETGDAVSDLYDALR